MTYVINSTPPGNGPRGTNPTSNSGMPCGLSATCEGLERRGAADHSRAAAGASLRPRSSRAAWCSFARWPRGLDAKAYCAGTADTVFRA